MDTQVRVFESIQPVVIMRPTQVGTTIVISDAIVNPWSIGRTLCAMFTSEDIAGSHSITIKPKLRRVGTATYDAIKQFDGVTDLAFPAQANNGVLDTQKFIYGEIDLERLKTKIDDGAAFDYDALVFELVSADNTSPPRFAGVGFIGHVRSRPVAETDLLFDKQRRQTGP